jgi:hypothetical protein
LAWALGAVAFTQAKKQTELGEQIVQQIGARENPSTEEAAAVAQLLSTSLSTRAAFLDRAMNTDPEGLRVNELGLSIALSRIKSSDAGALFPRAILPALTSSSDAQALLEGDALLLHDYFAGRSRFRIHLPVKISGQGKSDEIRATCRAGFISSALPRPRLAFIRLAFMRLAFLETLFAASHPCQPTDVKLGRVHTIRSASTMSAKQRNARKMTSSFSKREKMRRKPFSLRKSRSISLRFL